jgi:hypothetical protein
MKINMWKVGDKVLLDDMSGTVTAVHAGATSTKYDVRYGHTLLIAEDVPEDEIELWIGDEQ